MKIVCYFIDVKNEKEKEGSNRDYDCRSIPSDTSNL